MTRCVLDASVIIKWAIPDPTVEPHVDQAIEILQRIKANDLQIVQPPHWLAEVCATLVRLRPGIAERATAAIAAMLVDVRDTFPIYRQAMTLSHSLPHHLFDTLYHAVALQEPGTTLITADEVYYRKARDAGAIVRLADWPTHV